MQADLLDVDIRGKRACLHGLFERIQGVFHGQVLCLAIQCLLRQDIRRHNGCVWVDIPCTGEHSFRALPRS